MECPPHRQLSRGLITINPIPLPPLRIDSNCPPSTTARRSPAAANNNHNTITPLPTVDTADNAAATKKKKKSGPTSVVVGNKILEFLCEDTFNRELFQLKKKDQVKGEAYKKAEYKLIYTKEEMDKFDSAYQKFLIYDFDNSIHNKRMKEEKKQVCCCK